jgi:predicted Zn-dependent protease
VSPAARPGARRRSALARAAGAGLPALLALSLGGCVSEQREKELGDQIAANVNARVPLVHDAPLVLYVNDLGRLLARHSGRPGLEYHFYIVDTDGVNAFALPGGHIYVNRGLIERTRNVSELAGVLAHEIAHVSARHGAQSLERQMRTSSMSSLMYRMILGRGPILDQEALQLGTQLWTAEHSRADEAEADEMAVRYLVASGVDPRGMLTLFTTLLDEEQRYPQGASSQWFSSHPNTEVRLETTRQEIIQMTPLLPRQLASNNDSYPRFLERLNALPPPPPVILVR